MCSVLCCVMGWGGDSQPEPGRYLGFDHIVFWVGNAKQVCGFGEGDGDGEWMWVCLEHV